MSSFDTCPRRFYARCDVQSALGIIRYNKTVNGNDRFLAVMHYCVSMDTCRRAAVLFEAGAGADIPRSAAFSHDVAPGVAPCDCDVCSAHRQCETFADITALLHDLVVWIEAERTAQQRKGAGLTMHMFAVELRAQLEHRGLYTAHWSVATLDAVVKEVCTHRLSCAQCSVQRVSCCNDSQ